MAAEVSPIKGAAAKPLRVVLCCYCGTRQRAVEPPALQKCVECKRDFRVLLNQRGGEPIELGDSAKRFFKKRRGRVA